MKLCPTCGQQWPDDQKFCPHDGSALKTAGSSDLVGSVIAERYHIQKKLGEGGMGAVYLGEHVKMGRKSAIKVMTQAMASDPDAIARFNREAANAARINHPNVCAIYDFGETTDGLIYLAMEFIDGESLTCLLDREGALPLPRARPRPRRLLRLNVYFDNPIPKKDGEYEDRGGFWAPVELWHRDAERWQSLYQKGMRVLVEGRTVRDEWEDADENERVTFKIEARRVGILPYRIESLTLGAKPTGGQ